MGAFDGARRVWEAVYRCGGCSVAVVCSVYIESFRADRLR